MEDIEVQFEGPFIPNYEFCKYSILLNLPGNQPWSYRFRELLLMGSLVMDIAVYISYDDGKTWNEPLVHFWSPLFENGKHYVRIDTRYIYYNEKFNKKEKEKLLSNIQKLINDVKIDHEKYSKIASNGCKLMRSVKMKHVYQYMTDIWNMSQN